MNIKHGKNNWKIYWGVMPLPEGAEALGVVEHNGRKGALIKLANGNHVMGNNGGIRNIPKVIIPHKGGRTTRLYIRITPEDKRKLEQIAQSQNKSTADVIHEWIEKTESA